MILATTQRLTIMDGDKRVCLIADDEATEGSVSNPQHRCGWCGLLPVPGHSALNKNELCGACLALLTDLDWGSLLSDDATATAN
jgi:hypothetical protein